MVFFTDCLWSINSPYIINVYATWLDFWATRRVRTTSNGYDDKVAKDVAVAPHIKWVLDVLFNSSLVVDK